MRLFRFHFIFFLLMSGFACDDDLNDPVIVANLDNEFLVDLWEELDGENRSLAVDLSTIEELECSNFELEVSSRRSGNRLYIQLQKLEEPDDCRPGKSPALKRVNFGSLSPGFYQLDIDFLDIVQNELQLTVSPEDYQLEAIHTNGLIPAREYLGRVQPGNLWGFIATRDGLAGQADSLFVADLGSLTRAAGLSEGYYGYFSIGPSGEDIQLSEEPTDPSYNFIPFLLEQEGTDEAIKEILETYRTRHGAEVEIRLWNGRGEEW